MGVQTTDDKCVALVDTTSGTAFGPVFDSEFEADDFLGWLSQGYAEAKTFTMPNANNEQLHFLEDPRQYRLTELEVLVNLFRKEREEDDGE